MTRVVCVGAAVSDTIAVVDRFPGPDQRVVAETVTQAGGGPAATAAVAAARLGTPTHFVGTVGGDPEGERLVAGLAAEGVDTSGVAVAGPGTTASSVIISDTTSGTRAICVHPGGALQLTGHARRLIRSADWVHADHLGWPAVADALDGMAPANRPHLSVDGGNPVPDLDPAAIDLFVPTGERLAAEHGPLPLAELVTRTGAVRTVATLGADGAIGCDSDGSLHRVASLKVGAAGTLGAGDVFHGALLATAVRGDPLPDAMRSAAYAAALSCRGVDGRSAIPTPDELRQTLEENQ